MRAERETSMGGNSILFGGARARLIALRSGLTGNLGRCGFCMRTAFVTAALSWALVCASWLFAPAAMLVGAAAASFLLTALWIAHLIVRSARVTSVAFADVSQARREALLSFVRTFAMTAATTAVPVVARAQFNCPPGSLSCSHTYSCLDRNGNTPCCPQGQPYLCTIDCRCYDRVDACDSTYKCIG